MAIDNSYSARHSNHAFRFTYNCPLQIKFEPRVLNGSLKSSTVASMIRCAHLALDKFGGAAHSAVQADWRLQEIHKNALRVITRLCPVPALLKAARPSRTPRLNLRRLMQPRLSGGLCGLGGTGAWWAGWVRAWLPG